MFDNEKKIMSFLSCFIRTVSIEKCKLKKFLEILENHKLSDTEQNST